MAQKQEIPQQKPDSETEKFEAAKAQFEAAAQKTKAVEGSVPKAAVEAAAATPKVEEQAAEKPVVAKPKAPKKPAKVEPNPLETKLEALSARLEAALASKQEEPEEENPMDGIRAKLSERFGEEEASDLIEALETLHAPAAKRLAQLEDILKKATETGRRNLSKANQKRLAETFSQLSRDEAWEIVHNQAVAAFERDPKAYGSTEEAYDAIALAMYGEPESEAPEVEDATDDVEIAASRIASASMTAPAKTPRQEPRTQTEKAREVFDYLKKHPDDKAGAKRLARELRSNRRS